MDKARELGVSVSVVVVDPSGRVQHLSRMDGAGWFSPEIAMGKAVASAAFRADTVELVRRFEGKDVFTNSLAPLSEGRIVIAQGGCIIRGEGGILGAVGVSGATGEQDEICARAGIAGLSAES
jgi:uncharacterized protein GlcG (DUF336 family)